MISKVQISNKHGGDKMDRSGGHPQIEGVEKWNYCHSNSESQLLPLLLSLSPSPSSRTPKKKQQNHKQRAFISIVTASATASTAIALEQARGKMVVELVEAFNQLTQEINVLSSNSSRLLFKSLKLSIPLLHALPLSPDGRPPLSKALSLALLAHLQMDAEVISAGLLIQVLEAGAVSIYQVRDPIGTSTAHLLHESFQLEE